MKKRIGTPAEEHILKTLSYCEPMCLQDYIIEAGVNKPTGFERLKRAWDKKIIYVHHWEHGPAGPIVPYFAIGCLPDAPKIKRKDKNACCRAWRAKTKISNPERLKAMELRSREKFKERCANDPKYAQKKRDQKIAWARKKFGYQPKSIKESLPDLAMSIGSTWFFTQRKYRKAA